MVKVSHKEIQKIVLIHYSEYPDNFNFKNVLLDVVSVHNTNIHTGTNYKPIEIIQNTNQEIYDKVMENMDKSFHKFKDDLSDIKIGDHVFVKKNFVKNGKRLITRKLNKRNENIIGTITH